MADSLLTFWQQQLAIYQAEQKAAQDDLAAAQASMQAATAQLAADQKALDKTGADIAAARAKLAVTTIPADANALVAQITQMLITQRALQGAVLDGKEKIGDIQASLDSAAATLARVTARAASVQAKVTGAQADASRRDAYRAAVAAAPLSTLKNDATAFLAGATLTHAKTRIGKNFPDKLLAIAGKRHDSRVNRLKALRTDLDNAMDALANEHATDGGLDGAAAQKRIAFERAQDALAEYVANSANRFAKAKTVMAALEAIERDATGTVPDILTDAEKSQVTALTAADAALQAQILTSIGANVDTLATDPTIAAKRTAIDTARNNFKNALAAFAAA